MVAILFFTIIYSSFLTCYFFPTIDLVSWWIFTPPLLWSILILSYKFSGVPIFILFGNNIVPFIISSHSDICVFIDIYLLLLLFLSPSLCSSTYSYIYIHIYISSFFWDTSIGYGTVLISFYTWHLLFFRFFLFSLSLFFLIKVFLFWWLSPMVLVGPK